MEETAITIKSLNDIRKDNDMVSLIDQATTIKERAASLAVHDEKSSKEASDLRLESGRIWKMLDTRRKFFVDPYNAFVKTINAHFKDPLDTLAGVSTLLGSRMVKYSDEVNAAARAAEAKILADKRTTPETKSAKIAQVEEAPKVVRSDTGSTGFRIDKKLEIFDTGLLPRDYLIPDERFILAALKAGKEVPGAHLIDVKVPVGRSAF